MLNTHTDSRKKNAHIRKFPSANCSWQMRDWTWNIFHAWTNNLAYSIRRQRMRQQRRLFGGPAITHRSITHGKAYFIPPRAGTSGIFLGRRQPADHAPIRRSAIISNRIPGSAHYQRGSATQRPAETRIRRKSPARGSNKTSNACFVRREREREREIRHEKRRRVCGRKREREWDTAATKEREMFAVFQHDDADASRRYARRKMDRRQRAGDWGWKGGANHNRLSFVFGALFLRVLRTRWPFVRADMALSAPPSFRVEIGSLSLFRPRRLLERWRAEC